MVSPQEYPPSGPGVFRRRAWSVTALMAQAGMEMAWVSLWYAGLFEHQLRLPWWGLFVLLWALVALTFALARTLEARQVRMRRRQVVFVAWLLLAGLVTMKMILYWDIRADLGYLLLAPVRSITGADASMVPFLHLLLIPVLVLRGVMLASAVPEVRGGLLTFQTGLVAVMLHGLVYLPTHPNLPTTGLFVFLFLGLIMLISSRIVGVTNFRGGRLARLSPAWAIGMALTALVVIGLALLLGRAAVGSLGEGLARVFLAVLALLGMGIVIVLFPVFTAIIRLVLLVMEQLSGQFNETMMENLRKASQSLSGLTAQIIDRIVPTLNVLRVLLPVLLLLGVALLVLLWLRLRENESGAQDEDEASNVRPENLLDFLRRLARRGRKGGLVFQPGRALAAARIRRVYADLMSLCAKAGSPRMAWLTPLEFLPRAEALFPGCEAELALITRAYLKVRYGEYPENRAEVDEVLRAWRQVRARRR